MSPTSSTSDLTGTGSHACDTLLREASRDTSCWRYMRYQLLDIFATYGPDEVAQYLVDTYVVGEGSRKTR